MQSFIQQNERDKNKEGKKGKINIERWFPANTDAEDRAYRITSEILNTAEQKERTQEEEEKEERRDGSGIRIMSDAKIRETGNFI